MRVHSCSGGEQQLQDPRAPPGDSTHCPAQRGKNTQKEGTRDILLPKFLTSLDPFENLRVEKLSVGATEQGVS